MNESSQPGLAVISLHASEQTSKVMDHRRFDDDPGHVRDEILAVTGGIIVGIVWAVWYAMSHALK